MAPWTVTIEYLLPVWQHVVVRAQNIEAACAIAIQTDEWGDATEDYESARPTFVGRVVRGAFPDDSYDRCSLTIPAKYREQVSDPAARAVIEQLVSWQVRMGGFEAPCWRAAEKYLRGEVAR